MKKALLLFLVLLTLSFTACSSGENNSANISSESTHSASTVSVNNNDNTDNEDSNANEDTSFTLGVDDQPFYISKISMNVSNESGDYTFLYDTLYFYDNNAQTAVVVCNKPDCEHITNVSDGQSDCNAFFPQSKYYYEKGFAYYDNNIFMLGQGSDSNKSVSLYKISSDGATREEVCNLFSISDWNSIGIFTVHRGYAFWSLNTENATQLFMMNINDTNSIEKVFEADKFGANILRFAGAGDYLYFNYSYLEDENNENWSGTINRLNINTGKTSELINTRNCYTVMDNKIFYIDSGKLYSSTLDGKSITELTDTPGGSQMIVSDTKYLYLTNFDNETIDSKDYKIFVLTTDGKTVDTIPISDCDFFRGGYSDNMYIEATGRKLKVFDKSQIGTGKYEWKTVYTVTDTGEVILNE